MLEDKRNSGIKRTSEISMIILINTIVEKENFSYVHLLRRKGEGILEYNGMIFFLHMDPMRTTSTINGLT